MNTQLSDERVDAMRSEVLGSVDADIARRGRRTRKAIAGGVGALALVTVLGVSIPALTHGDSHVTSGGAAMSESDTREALPQPADNMTAKQAAPNGYDADIAPVPPEPSPLTAPGKTREVVTTGSAEVQVKDPSERANQFTAWVEKHDGRVDGRTETRDDEGHTSAHVTARVPGKALSASLAELRSYGTVERLELLRDDVTAQGQDLDARIKALKISVARLEGILQRAGSSSQVIEAETALSERQQELESLQLQRRSLNDQVALSTIEVSFVQEAKPGTVAPGGFRGGLVKGWNALVDTVNAVVTAAGALIPWLGIAAIVALLWWGVRRARRRR
ncbi:MAG TPA: DUF4349 domain-containing protein [Aeromicrobium sp.]|nr:DUF4349 domain-containing protein [Aeromicrobium sp.]